MCFIRILLGIVDFYLFYQYFIGLCTSCDFIARSHPFFRNNGSAPASCRRAPSFCRPGHGADTDRWQDYIRGSLHPRTTIEIDVVLYFQSVQENEQWSGSWHSCVVPGRTQQSLLVGELKHVPCSCVCVCIFPYAYVGPRAAPWHIYIYTRYAYGALRRM